MADKYAMMNLYFVVCAGLAIVTFAVFWPVRNHEFVRLDDDEYITENAAVQSGLTRQNVKWAFTSGYASNWHPMTWLSHQLDCQLFGLNPAGHHIVNILFHIANTLLLFVVFERMTGRIRPSALIAALFALHPLHVESVAWVAERKDVLSTLFWLLTMLAYIHYVRRPSLGRYLFTLVLFALGLMAKPMLVTLPFVLLVLDYWPLDRLGNPKYKTKRLLLEKLPLLFLAAVSSIITFIVQQRGGAVRPVAVLPFYDRLANAVASYLAYIGKMFRPTSLAVFYPLSVGGVSVARAVIYAIILILITILLFYYGRSRKYLIFGWLWYLGTLVPVIGIVQVGAQAMADRYTYVPLVGLFVIIAFSAADLSPIIPFRKIVLPAAGAISLIACAVITSGQLKFWKNSITLFEHTLAVTKNNGVILNNYANLLSDLGRRKEAVELFNEAIKFMPDIPDVRSNLGKVLLDLGRTDEGIEQYKKAIELNPSFTLAHYNLANAFLKQGKYDAAIEQYKICLGPDADLRRDVDNPQVSGWSKGFIVDRFGSVEVLSNLGYALAQSGKHAEAIECYYKALKIDPDHVITHGRLALALIPVGRIDEAIEQCRVVLKARPGDFEMYNNIGILLRSKGDIDGAAESFKKALQINPDFTKARENLTSLTQNQP